MRVLGIAIFLSTMIFPGCAGIERFEPKSEISLARMPAALEKRIIDAGYVPWDPLAPIIAPGAVVEPITSGGVLSTSRNTFQVKWNKDDCFPRLPDPTPSGAIEIQSVSVNDSEASFGIDFLDLAKSQLMKAGITAFTISLTEVTPTHVATGHLATSSADPRCQNVIGVEPYLPVNAVLHGKVQIKFFQHNNVAGNIALNKVFQGMNLEAKGFARATNGDSVVSSDAKVLGFQTPGRSSEDILSSSFGLTRSRIMEANILNSYTISSRDKDAQAQIFKFTNANKDAVHSLSHEIIELWIDEVDFTLKKYSGRSMGAQIQPLLLSGFSSGESGEPIIWEKGSDGQRVPSEVVSGYEPLNIRRVEVGRSFSILHAYRDVNSFCTEEREYDYFTFATTSRFAELENFSFLFLVKREFARSRNYQPMSVVELKEKYFDGQAMYLPQSLADTTVDNLRLDYGDQALEKLLMDTVGDLRIAYPDDEKLKSIHPSDYEGYRVVLRPGERKYGITFKCYKTKSGI